MEKQQNPSGNSRQKRFELNFKVNSKEEIEKNRSTAYKYLM